MSIINFDIESFSPNKNGILYSNENISIKLTKDINRGTLSQNVLLIKDVNHKINNYDDLSNNIFENTPISIKLRDRVIDVFPESELLQGSRYVLIIRNHLTSVVGETLFKDFLIPFTFKVVDIAPCIVYPVTNTIVENLSRIEIKATNIVQLQICKNIDFKILVLNKTISSNMRTYILEEDLDNNERYYIRVGKNDIWSDSVQIFVSRHIKDVENIYNELEDISIEGAFTEENGILSEETSSVLFPTNTERVYISYNRVMIKFNKLFDISSLEDIIVNLYEVFDLSKNEETIKELDYKSISFLKDEMNSYIVLEL